MKPWLGYLLAFAALLVIAPAVAWLGRRHGRNLKGGAGLAFFMLGLGVVMDPPKRHAIEAVADDEDDQPQSGEPKVPVKHR